MVLQFLRTGVLHLVVVAAVCCKHSVDKLLVVV